MDKEIGSCRFPKCKRYSDCDIYRDCPGYVPPKPSLSPAKDKACTYTGACGGKRTPDACDRERCDAYEPSPEPFMPLRELWQSIYDELTIYEARAAASELPAEHTQDIVTNKIYSLIQAWHLEKVQQVRKDFAEECIKTMPRVYNPSVGGVKPDVKRQRDVCIAHLRAMAEGVGR